VEGGQNDDLLASRALIFGEQSITVTQNIIFEATLNQRIGKRQTEPMTLERWRFQVLAGFKGYPEARPQASCKQTAFHQALPPTNRSFFVRSFRIVVYERTKL